MIEQKEAVIPSEVDPFVHERINAVGGPAVSAPKCDRSSRGKLRSRKSRFLHAPMDCLRQSIGLVGMTVIWK
jgi:hypothetical protein